MTEAEGGGGANGEEEDVDAGRLSRKEKRKLLKKMKRKERRKDVALKEKEEEDSKLNDLEEQRRIEALEREEKERVERERKEFEERERLWMEKMKKKQEEEEEEARRRMEEEEELERNLVKDENNDSDGFEYVEEGPAEIIWQGNEIIVKKKKVKVPKKREELTIKEEAERPTSNPLPPQSEVYMDSFNAPVFSAQQAYDNLAQQVPSFGTEQDKAHCPFHIKTGVCRFGARCNRAHFYPDKSCTLLIKNMYSGPGLAWEQDEALEYSEEEVERSFEEFYEDVHTEFLKFGEIINFKVCRNGSAHLRGNVYVHYKLLDSALLAFQSINGRFFAGKQLKCEFVGVTRWKVAICGEYMKTRLSACSRGSACNFIHCFRNPGGDYEWADWDKPPPKYWINKMSALFGYTDIDEFRARSPSHSQLREKNSLRIATPDTNRYYHSKKSRSRERDSSSYSSHRDNCNTIYRQGDTQRHRHKHDGRRNSEDTPERDCMDTVMLRQNSGEVSHSRKSSGRQSRDEGFTLSVDEIYECSADRDRSRKEPCSETHGSRASSRLRHEVEDTKDSKASHSRMCGSESETNGNGGRTKHASKVRDRIHCTNWDKGRDGEEERLTHEENRADRKRRDKNKISHKRTSHEMAVSSRKDGKEDGHGRQKKRRSSELIRESSVYLLDYGDKKKRQRAESHEIHSDDEWQSQTNSPVSDVVGFIDRWDPSEK